MRVAIHDTDVVLSGALRRYAETRVWLAVQQVADRISWLGIRPIFCGDAEHPAGWQIDAWLRGDGLVSVRQSNTNPFVGLDMAAARLEHAIQRRRRLMLDALAQPPAPAQQSDDAETFRPPMAVVIVPSGHWPRAALRRWLREHYGIEQIQTLRLAAVEWDGLASRAANPIAADRIGSRLALCLLGRPAMVVVFGHEAANELRGTGPRSRQELWRVVRRLRTWQLPVPVMGVWWTNPTRTADHATDPSTLVPIDDAADVEPAAVADDDRDNSEAPAQPLAVAGR